MDMIKTRLNKNCPTTEVTLKLPVDVIDSLQQIAQHKKLMDYQALLRSYIGEGLRQDEKKYLFNADKSKSNTRLGRHFGMMTISDDFTDELALMPVK